MDDNTVALSRWGLGSMLGGAEGEEEGEDDDIPDTVVPTRTRRVTQDPAQGTPAPAGEPLLTASSRSASSPGLGVC